MNNHRKTIDRARARILAEMLPDIATVSTTSSVTIDAMGVVTPVRSNRVYEGSANIPCRIDASRSMRAEMLANQEAVSSEFLIHFPWDFVVAPDDRITINSRTYEVRKLGNTSDWDYTYEVTVNEVVS